VSDTERLSGAVADREAGFLGGTVLVVLWRPVFDLYGEPAHLSPGEVTPTRA
jgi:hypothetical protein